MQVGSHLIKGVSWSSFRDWTRRSCTWSRRRTTGTSGGIQIFANAATPHWRTPEEEAAHTEYLYGLATYTRRRLVEVPFGLDHPYWIEDPAFDREFHERFIAVPAPGTDRQLEQVVSRLASRPLDRSRPLWEVYLIEGVDEGRKFALYSKTHHCAIDGASGTQLALATMQLTPEAINHPMPATPWRPERVPSQAEMLARGLAATVQRPAKLLGVQRRAAPPDAQRAAPRQRRRRASGSASRRCSTSCARRRRAPCSTSASASTAASRSGRRRWPRPGPSRRRSTAR